jgi:hypothetical protein
MTQDRTFPFFVFARDRDAEREAGFVLAGTLLVDIPKCDRPQHVDPRIASVVQQLVARASSMPDDAFIFGWAGGTRPANAVDIDDDELMAAWVRDRLQIDLQIEVRVDPRPPRQPRTTRQQGGEPAAARTRRRRVEAVTEGER